MVTINSLWVASLSFVQAGCLSAGAPPNTNTAPNLSVYEGVSVDNSTGGLLTRLSIERDLFSSTFIRDGALVTGDPGMGGGLRVEHDARYVYVGGLGVIIPKKAEMSFAVGLSTCGVTTSSQEDRITVCRLPNGNVSSRSVVSKDWRLMEFNAPCAAPSVCNYTLKEGTGRFDWLVSASR